MAQRACRTRFTLKPHDGCRITRKICREHLESNIPIQAQISRSINIAHAASPDQLQDFEVVELVPTLQLWTLLRGLHRRIFQKGVSRISGIQKRQYFPPK